MAAYEASMKLWPVPYEQMDITGGYGGTHLVIAGPKDAPAFCWNQECIDYSKVNTGRSIRKNETRGCLNGRNNI